MFDQYSLLHFASGVTAYFWGIGPLAFAVIHLGWEAFEYSSFGLAAVNKYWHWPGRKKPMERDSVAGSIGDNIAGNIGYWSARYLDEYGKAHGWYDGDREKADVQ